MDADIGREMPEEDVEDFSALERETYVGKEVGRSCCPKRMMWRRTLAR